MRTCFVVALSFALIILPGCSPKGEVEYLVIEFDGAKDEFYEKYNLVMEVRDSSLVQLITGSFDKAEKRWFCPSQRPVMWQIKVFPVYTSDKSKYLFTVGSSTGNDLSLSRKNWCYNNDDLIDFMIDLMRVEEIRQFEGEMRQEEYDQIRYRE